MGRFGMFGDGDYCGLGGFGIGSWFGVVPFFFLNNHRWVAEYLGLSVMRLMMVTFWDRGNASRLEASAWSKSCSVSLEVLVLFVLRLESSHTTV